MRLVSFHSDDAATNSAARGIATASFLHMLRHFSGTNDVTPVLSGALSIPAVSASVASGLVSTPPASSSALHSESPTLWQHGEPAVAKTLATLKWKQRLTVVTDIVEALRDRHALPTLIWMPSSFDCKTLFQGMVEALHRSGMTAGAFIRGSDGLLNALRAGIAIIDSSAPGWYIHEVCRRCAANTIDVLLTAGGVEHLAQLPSPAVLRRRSVIILPWSSNSARASAAAAEEGEGEDGGGGSGTTAGARSKLDPAACRLVLQYAASNDNQGHVVFAGGLHRAAEAFSSSSAAPSTSAMFGSAKECDMPCERVPLSITFASQVAALPGIVRFHIAQRLANLTEHLAKCNVNGSESPLALDTRVPLVFHRAAAGLLGHSALLAATKTQSGSDHASLQHQQQQSRAVRGGQGHGEMMYRAPPQMGGAAGVTNFSQSDDAVNVALSCAGGRQHVLALNRRHFDDPPHANASIIAHSDEDLLERIGTYS